jgi:hypothetical protein
MNPGVSGKPSQWWTWIAPCENASVSWLHAAIGDHAIRPGVGVVTNPWKGGASHSASQKMRKAIFWLVRKTCFILEKRDQDVIFFAPFNVNFVVSGTLKGGLP